MRLPDPEHQISPGDDVTTRTTAADILRDELIASGKVPTHIAIIMDGNGRWARQRELDRIAGHQEGVRAVRRVVEAAVGIGVDVLTLYVFSQENWKRPMSEVRSLMHLLSETIEAEIDALGRNQVQLRITGDISEILPEPRQGLHRALERTADNSGMILNLALNYGGRREILRAIERLLASRMASGSAGPVTAEEFESFLLTRGLPDPDLLIRTSGEQRLSNFLLWQSAYAEIYFTPTLWPDFDQEAFYRAVHDYVGRERRYGRTSDQIRS
jgi:undecaprenyl diphosphate synthase